METKHLKRMRRNTLRVRVPPDQPAMEDERKREQCSTRRLDRLGSAAVRDHPANNPRSPLVL